MARRHDGREEHVAVAIDKDKNSQYALKWAIEHCLSRGQLVTLVHVKTKPSSVPTPTGSHVNICDVHSEVAKAYRQQLESRAREVFLPFRCFCSRKNIKCNEVVLEETDIAKALIEYVAANLIETLVLGSSSRNSLVRRFRSLDVPSSVSKGAPDYCTVYVISKGKIASARSASASVPNTRYPPRAVSQYSTTSSNSSNSDHIDSPTMRRPRGNERSRFLSREETEVRSPFLRSGHKYEPSVPESDISFVSSRASSTDRMFPSLFDSFEVGTTPRLSNASDVDSRSSLSSFSATNSKSTDFSCLLNDYSSTSTSTDSPKFSYPTSSHYSEEMEAEMRRIKLELKQTMEMYNAACKEALTARHKAGELHRWKLQEEQKLEEARSAEEAALVLAEQEKARCKAAVEAAEAAKIAAELEMQKRSKLEHQKTPSFGHDTRYRKYTIEEIELATDNFSESRKVGEGGYGPVYKCNLDHTPVAVKVLRPDAAQGRQQFNQEIEVLSCIRHPNMVLLLGACPEYGCLVYEYMANGSLEDCLFRKGNTPILPWKLRFQIAAEIATGLLFLHQTKPEPLVHRDLKPGNILLDRNYVSKISDVGLARLVPQTQAAVTQYRMTSTAGTFCYIDPEYQQTGMLGTKSDVYSLGILLLQLLTAKPPMGLTHLVEEAIEDGTFAELLDPAVPDWPIEEATNFAKLALQCAEMRRRDRPDLDTVILPELDRLRELAEESMPFISPGRSPHSSQHDIHSNSSSSNQDAGSPSQMSGNEGSRGRASTSSTASINRNQNVLVIPGSEDLVARRNCIEKEEQIKSPFRKHGSEFF